VKRPPPPLTGIGCGSRGRLALSHGFAPPPRVSPSPPTRLSPQGKGVFQELSSRSIRDPLETKGFGKIRPTRVSPCQTAPRPDSVTVPRRIVPWKEVMAARCHTGTIVPIGPLVPYPSTRRPLDHGGLRPISPRHTLPASAAPFGDTPPWVAPERRTLRLRRTPFRA